MRARALVCDEHQHFALEEVTLADISSEHITVRTLYSGVSIGTEFALIRRKISWGPYPLCTGYMGTGVVEQVGSAVSGFKPGDSVFFRANESMSRNTQKISCVSGTHCSHVVLKPGGTHGADHLPAGAPADLASMFVMPAVGYHGVNTACPKSGEHVVVYGCGLIGLGVVAACAARGCVVTAVDLRSTALAMARKLGADYAVDPQQRPVVEHLQQITPQGAGADVVFECTGLPQCLDPAMKLCRKFGAFVWQGNYGQAPVSLNWIQAHGRQLRMFFPCDDGGPTIRRAVMKHLASGSLDWATVITHRVLAADAPKLYNAINAGDESVIGAIIEWSK